MLPSFDFALREAGRNHVHGMHPYAAKFTPEIPRKLLGAFTQPGDIVLDPFCGSGTTLVEALLADCIPIGIDTNPIACLASYAKTTPPSRNELTQIKGDLNIWEQNTTFFGNSSIQYDEPPEITFLNSSKWFHRDALKEVEGILTFIGQIESIRPRQFLLASLSATIVRISNQESETRWRAIQKPFSRGSAIAKFVKKARDNIKRVEEFYGKLGRDSLPEASIHCADSRYLDFISDNSIDLALSSPPYMNSYDYYLYHKLRMFILGFDHKKTQEQEIGSRNKHSDKSAPEQSFYTEMAQCIAEIARKLRPKAHLCFVVGDSILNGRLVDMGCCYKSIVKDAGLSLIDSYSYPQTKYTRTFSRTHKNHRKKSHIMLFQKLP